MHRRTLLTVLGGTTLSFAGCTTEDSTRGSPTADGGPTLAPGETYETDDGRTLQVDEPAVHPSVVTVEYISSTHYYERVADAGSVQYVAFVVKAEGFDLETEKRKLYDRPIGVPLAVEADGERYADPIPVGRDGRAYWDRVAVRVPIVDATDAAIRWKRDDGPSPRWRLEASTVEHLTASPAFEVRSWSVPDKVEHGESFEASVAVKNVGDRDGRFLATFGARQGSLGVPEVAVEVPVGETRTRTVRMEPHYFEGMDSLRVVLEWDVDQRETTVEVTAAG